MECPICFNLIENSCIGSCTHHFCYNCIMKWCSSGKYTCPICKTKIRELRFDKEFDSINNPNCKLPIINFTKSIIIEFNNILPEITLKNSKGLGVIISKISKNGACFLNGMREQDIIVSINNISCKNHIDCIDIINHSYKR